MSYPRFIGNIEKNSVIITDDEFHHAVKVKRIKEGQFIEVNNLKGNIVLAKVEKIEKKKLIGHIVKELPVEEEKVKITLYQCMPNHLSKVDDLIEPISELGVYTLVPVLSKFSAVKEKDVLKKIKKWEKIAINSIKQCKRPYPLKIENPIKLKDIKANQELKIVFYEKEKRKLNCNQEKKVNSIGVLIGAEGGLSEEEINILKEKGFLTYSLGKNILRMETAVITGICQVKFIFD